MSGRRRAFGSGGALALGVGLLVALPAAAWAAATPGGVYTGKAADGATVNLTVSSDGTLVDSYQITGIFGKDANGAVCQGTAADIKNDVWPGATISANGFQDSTPYFSIAGTFNSPQSVSGSFSMNNPPTPATNGNAGSAGCTTGTVTWTATLARTNGGGPGGGGSGGGGSGGGGSGGGSGGGGSNGGPPKHKTTIHVKVGFRRMSAGMLGGTLKPATKSSSKACTARRAVILWSGRKQLRRARTTAKGAFKFKVTNAMRRRSVHASVRSLKTSSVNCASANSSAVKVTPMRNARASKASPRRSV